jgi:pimeloyl-ACP methyl ester carboxylesterase
LLAALYAARHPQGVRSLVLVDSLPPAHSELELARTFEHDRLAAYQARGLVPAELPSIEDDPAGWLLARLPIYFVDPRHPGARTLGGARLSPKPAAAACLALRAYDVRDELARVRTPTLHVTTPVPFGYAMGEAMANALTNAPARRVRLTTAGHLPFVEAPAPFLSVLTRFLRPAA